MSIPGAWCRDCGPGYRIGDEGCRHDPYVPEIGETGVCRTCALPIWWEEGEVGHRKVVGWSDRIERGGDSAVCFKAAGYRHVPMGSREEAIYRAGVRAGQQLQVEAAREALLAEADKVEAAWPRHRDHGKRCCAASLYPLPDLIRESADRIGGER